MIFNIYILFLLLTSELLYSNFSNSNILFSLFLDLTIIALRFKFLIMLSSIASILSINII